MLKKLTLVLAFLLVVTVVRAADSLLPPPKHGGVYVAAHRGAHEGIPENTLAAYQKAIDLGADFVEIDVRTTKDGKFVSVHNSTIDSYAPGHTGRVSEMTLDELRALDIGSRVGPEWAGTKIPTFEEVLDLCKGKIGIYLDLKAAPVPPLVEAIKARGMERNVIWYVGGPQLHELKEVCPECIPMPDPGPEENLAKLLADEKPRIVASVWEYYSKSFLDACHKAGAIVIVDESDPTCWEQALAWGTDGIQTDHPADLIKLLEERAKKTADAGEAANAEDLRAGKERLKSLDQQRKYQEKQQARR
ncbi:MAG: glycerophosphodiester phosphodiesterase family protein [Candidatus Hydrogenedentes bacterium]|nr:glycerophosphodiester phosphodiesterase family protein [Candidatus Hydrogenedentota bacterium]